MFNFNIFSAGVFLILLISLLRYATGDVLYSYIHLSLSISLVIYIFLVERMRLSVGEMPFFFVLIACILVSLFSFRYGGLSGVFYSLTIGSSYYIASHIVKRENVSLRVMSKIILFLFFIFFFFNAAVRGVAPEAVNEYAYGSRNMLSAIAIFLQLFYYCTYYAEHRKFPKISPFLTLLICFICYGRSGIALGIVMFMIPWIYEAKIKMWLFYVSLSFIVIGLASFKLDFLFKLFTENTNFHAGFDSPRFDMYKEYFMGMNFVELLIGRSYEELYIISSYDNNPHNSFIHGHHFMGAAYFLLLFMILLRLMVGFFLNYASMPLLLLLFVFLARIFFDQLGIPGFFDIIFFYIYFMVLSLGKERFRVNFNSGV